MTYGYRIPRAAQEKGKPLFYFTAEVIGKAYFNWRGVFPKMNYPLEYPGV